MNDTLDHIADRLYYGDAAAVAELTQRALDEGLTPTDVLNKGLIVGMDRVGADFRNNVVYIPEVLVAARAMRAGIAILRPLLAQGGAPSAGKVVLGTVEGDVHDIGKNLVAMMLEGGGFEVVDLGTGVPPDNFIEAINTVRPDLVAMSALLTTTMMAMKRTIDALGEAGLREKVKVIVGGAPVTKSFAHNIGADGYAPDAASAVELARSLIG